VAAYHAACAARDFTGRRLRLYLRVLVDSLNTSTGRLVPHGRGLGYKTWYVSTAAASSSGAERGISDASTALAATTMNDALSATVSGKTSAPALDIKAEAPEKPGLFSCIPAYLLTHIAEFAYGRGVCPARYYARVGEHFPYALRINYGFTLAELGQRQAVRRREQGEVGPCGAPIPLPPNLDATASVAAAAEDAAGDADAALIATARHSKLGDDSSAAASDSYVFIRAFPRQVDRTSDLLDPRYMVADADDDGGAGKKKKKRAATEIKEQPDAGKATKAEASESASKTNSPTPDGTAASEAEASEPSSRPGRGRLWIPGRGFRRMPRLPPRNWDTGWPLAQVCRGMYYWAAGRFLGTFHDPTQAV
jgi:hypothetical protein